MRVKAIGPTSLFVTAMLFGNPVLADFLYSKALLNIVSCLAPLLTMTINRNARKDVFALLLNGLLLAFI